MMEKRESPNKAEKYKKTKYNSDYDRGVTRIDRNVVVSTKEVALSKKQAETLNQHFNNTGVEYTLVQEKSKGGRPKKEEIKTEE